MDKANYKMDMWSENYKMAFANFINKLDSNKRIITSAFSKIISCDIEQNYKEGLTIGKPSGIWYSCGGSWIEWCLNEDFCFPHYVHEIDIVDWRLVMIDNVDDFDDFCKEYGLNIQNYFALKNQIDTHILGRSIDCINWTIVAEGWSGIEINPYLWSRRLNSLWYYGWDCASGCIWDTRAIKKIELLAVYNEEKKCVEYV